MGNCPPPALFRCIAICVSPFSSPRSIKKTAVKKEEGSERGKENRRSLFSLLGTKTFRWIGQGKRSEPVISSGGVLSLLHRFAGTNETFFLIYFLPSLSVDRPNWVQSKQSRFLAIRTARGGGSCTTFLSRK